MYHRIITRLFIAFTISLFLPLLAYANPAKDEFFNKYNLTEREAIRELGIEQTYIPSYDFNIVTPSAINEIIQLEVLEDDVFGQENQVEKSETENILEFNEVMEISEPPIVQYEDINDYGNLYLHQGFDSEKIPTFSKTKTISGQGEVGASVGILVANSVTEGALNVTYIDLETTIGASGIYSKTINLSVGTNYVIIATDNKWRAFTINRKEEETKELLENITIDFKPLVEEEVVEEEEIIEEELEESIFDFLEILDISEIIDILK